MVKAEYYGSKLEPEYVTFVENYWSMIRQKRDELIIETDWTQATDAPLSAEKKAAFLAYRQALRDIPQNYSDPDDVVWPTKPEI
ncbi:phage tail assembly chaperone [Vibrio cholerae]|nr:phage tail assembly chaperone [Vibrio cholerae]EHV9953750.1 phage tail assembly chaperone [Vibrio cholerae]